MILLPRSTATVAMGGLGLDQMVGTLHFADEIPHISKMPVKT